MLLFNANGSAIMGTTISRMMIDKEYGSMVFIDADGEAKRSKGHCHSNKSWDFVLLTDDETGKQMYMQLLSAFETNKSMKLVGTKNCIANGGIESLKRIEIY